MRAVYPGCVQPVSTVLVVETDDTAFDLTDVDAGRIKVTFADGRTASWDADLSDADTGEITLTRQHLADDIPAGAEGTAYIYAELDIGLITIATSAGPLPVVKLGV